MLEDHCMIGYLRVAEKLITHISHVDNKALDEVYEQHQFEDSIMYQCLFLTDKCNDNDVKCRTKESKAACYFLLIRYVESLSIERTTAYLENHLWALIQDMPKLKKWRYMPQEQTK